MLLAILLSVVLGAALVAFFVRKKAPGDATAAKQTPGPAASATQAPEPVKPKAPKPPKSTVETPLPQAAAGALKGHTDVVTDLVFRPDGKSLVTLSADRSLRLWDVATLPDKSRPLPARINTNMDHGTKVC
jgi:hypothetical protein